MSKYDRERQSLGLGSQGTSKYAEERQRLLNPQPYSGPRPPADPRRFPMVEAASSYVPESPEPQRRTLHDRVLQSNPVGRFLSNVSDAAARMMIPNAPMIGRREDGSYGSLPGQTARERYMENNPVESTGSRAADFVARGIGTVAGAVMPMSGAGSGPLQLYTAPGTQALAQRAASALPSRVSNPVTRRIAEEATREGITGAAIGAQRAVQEGQTSAGGFAGNIALEGAIGAGVGGAVGGLSVPVRRIIEKWRKPDTPASPVLALPEPRRQQRIESALERSNLPARTEPIVNPHTFELPAPSAQTRRLAENAKEARSELSEINTAIKELQDQYDRQVVEQYQWLRESMKNRQGVDQGALLRNAEGEVIDRVGRTSNNPVWYQEFFQQHNRRPTLRDLHNLAKQHVDQGFRDETAFIPSWRQQNNYDELIETLTSVRDNIQGSLREIDPAIHITDARLKASEFRFQRQGMPSTPTERPTATQARETQAAQPIPSEVDEVVQAVNEPRVRDRVYGYLDEQEKAARERLRSRGTRLSSNPLDDLGDYAIIMASRLGKGTIKAADFTEELVKEFGESVRPYANEVHRRAREILRVQQRRASSEARSAEAFNNSGRGDEVSFDAKISRNVRRNRQPFRQRWEQLRTRLMDDMAPLEGLERRVTGQVASAEESLYKSARLYKGAPERAAQIVETRLAPVIKRVEDAGYTADDLGRYALARHAKDVNAAGYMSGFTNAEIDKVLSLYGKKEIVDAQRELVKINNDMLRELVGSGVISKELAETLTERWKNYVPLFRSFDDEVVEFGSGLSSALANVASPIKALEGSRRAVIDPLENMVKNVFQSVNAAERNKVAQQLANLATKDKEARFIRKLDEGETVGRKNVVTVKENGENIRYEVEPEVYRAMLELDRESSNILVNILSRPASVLRAGATLTPEFSLRNPIRDVFQAFMTSSSGFNPITDFGAGLIQAISKGNLYRDWIDNLGAYGNVLSMDRKVHRQALEKVLKEPPSKKFVNLVSGRSILRVLRAIADTTESATKIGEYRAALRKGASKQEAAYRSRDVMDFARAGSSVRQVNRIIAFFNANIQGKSKILRAVRENPWGVIGRGVSLVTAPTIGIYLWNHLGGSETQKETISEAPDWMRDTFWLVAVPGTDIVARIPKPFDIAPILANLPERALDFLAKKDPEAFEGFARRSMNDLLIPTQITGLLPIMEGMANYSFFRDSNIIPMAEQGREFRDQYDPVRTTELARLLAAGAERVTGGEGPLANFSSPRIMDNTIRGFTAGLGDYVNTAIDAIVRGIRSDRPERPAKRIEQQPLMKAFTVDSTQSSKSMDKFYSTREKLQREKTSASINGDRFSQNGLLNYLNKSATRLSDINKRIRSIESDAKLSSKEKRERIDPLIQRRNEIVKTAVERID